jgi:hypothetical protein
MAKKDKRILFDSWRLLLFLLIAVIAASIGYYLKSAANPGVESKQFAGQSPLALDFYASNPDASVSLQLFIDNSDSETLYVAAKIPNGGPGYVLMLASIPDQFGYLHHLTPPTDRALSTQISWPYDSYYEYVIKRTTLIPDSSYESYNNYTLVNIPFYFASGKVIENTNAASYGHLPSIDSLYQALPFQDTYPCIVGKLDASADVSQIYIDPHGPICQPGDDNSYNWSNTFEDPHAQAAFFYPAQVSTAEILTGVAATFKTEEVNYINPSGNIDGDSFVWQSNSNLEPIFEVTNQDAVQDESNDAFLAGIAFAVAAGAAIAAVQAVPKRKRKPVPPNRAGEKHHQDDTPEHSDAQSVAGRETPDQG